MYRKLIFLTAFLFLIIDFTQAQWDGNSATVDNPVTITHTGGNGFYTVPDGAGGVIAVWGISGDSGLYAQRKGVAGNIIWGDSITPVQLTTSSAFNVRLNITDVVSDGAGGAYIAWEGFSDTVSNTYIQHINSSGAVLLANGLRVNAADGHYNWLIKLAADTAGVIATWTDNKDSADTFISSQVYAQRFNKAGIAQWDSGGVAVSTASGNRQRPAIVSDGNNGAFISFDDTRNSIAEGNAYFKNVSIYAQHIGSSGTRLWGNNGVAVSSPNTNNDMEQPIIPDGTGGVIIAYEIYALSDWSFADNFYSKHAGNIYLQHLSSSGTVLWAPGGTPVATPTLTYKTLATMVSDAAGGAVLLWHDEGTFEGDSLIVAQRVTAAGAASWGASGKIISAIGSLFQYLGASTLNADGAGNYIVNWSAQDHSFAAYILGQKLDSSGVPQWAANGVNICANPKAYPGAPRITKSDGNNMIAFWEDYRNGTAEIYSAKITPSGTLVTSIIYRTVADGNWDNPATWLGNIVPAAGADIIIQNKVIGNLTTTCNSLTVQSPGSLTINTGINIIVLH